MAQSVNNSGHHIGKGGDFVQFSWCQAYAISRTGRYIGPGGTYETSN